MRLQDAGPSQLEGVCTRRSRPSHGLLTRLDYTTWVMPVCLPIGFDVHEVKCFAAVADYNWDSVPVDDAMIGRA